MSQFNAPTYEVERPTGRCAITGRELVPKEPYIATLVEEGDKLRRLDVCIEAWDQGQRPQNLFCFWRSVVPEPNAKKKVFVDDEVLMDLLRRLAEADQPQRIALRFVLMLILMRKKLLRYNRTETRPGPDGALRQWWNLTPKLDLSKGPLGKWNDPETIEVLDPQLDEAAIRSVTEQLGEILQTEL